jgi:hypothetical protein
MAKCLSNPRGGGPRRPFGGKRLDGPRAAREVTFMQKKNLALAALPLAALLILPSCNNKPQTIVAGDDDPQAEQLKSAKPVAPPPMIQASRTYRCKDNSLVYADFYTNNTVAVRSKKDAAPTILTSPDGTAPYTAEGYSISANAHTISYAGPGKGAQPCDDK